MSISDFEIEKYFDGDLTDEQKLAFEEKMQADALFAREVREHRQLRRDMQMQGDRLRLLEQMEEVHFKEYGGIPYLKENDEKTSVSDQKEQKTEEKEPKTTKKEVSEKPKKDKPGGGKVITMKMFYIGICAAASLAALLTLGGVFLSNYSGSGDLVSEAAFEPLMMEEEKAEGGDTNAEIINPRITPAGPSKNRTFSATAFAIAKDGYFITNNHVIKGNKKLRLKIIGEDNTWQSYEAKVVLQDETSDLAMVQITDSNFKELGILPFTFSDKSSPIGEEIFTLGYSKKDIVMEPGIISSTSGLDGDTTAYQVAMSLNGGNSGGPIFNSKGEVVAVVKGKHNDKEGTGYVVRSDYLWDLIEKYETEQGSKIKRPKWNQLKGKTTVRMIKHIRQFVYMVEAEK